MQELPKNRIIENLYYIMKDKGFSKQKELSDELGISSGHISMWFNTSRTEIIPATPKNVLAIAKLGYNPDWFFYGQGSPYLQDDIQNNDLVPSNIPSPVQKIVNLPVYDLPINCSTGVRHQFTDLPLSYKPLYLSQTLDPLHTIVFRASGISMQDVGIMPNDYIVVDTVTIPRSEDIVVFDLDGYIIAKKYKTLPDGSFQLYSENGGEHPFDIREMETLTKIGVVVMQFKYFNR